MKELTLADQVMDSLAFEVEEVPQDAQLSSVSSSSPLNVKIRIRKKNKKQLQDGGIISIPKIDQEIYDNEKIRAASSDQTITSFNVLMDREQFIRKRPPKQKRIMQLFKRGGCLGVQNDEDQYEYTKGTTQQADKEKELPETTESLSNDGPNNTNFTLAKNYSNIEASQINKQKHTDFLGKCKPGGCLDPPFGEDKYSYLPKFIDVAVADQTKTNECECKDTLNPNNTKIKSNDQDISYNPIVKTEKNKHVCKPCDSNSSLLQLKNSNSIITFPSISSPSEALNKLQIQRRSKSYSGSRESKSYSESNQLLETYYISPKIKAIDQSQKSVTVSKAYIDTENVDISTIKSKENLSGETKFESHYNSELDVNKNLENADKTALRLTNKEIIPIDIINDVTRGDEPTLLRKQENDIESIRMDGPSIINVMTDTSPLKTDDIVSNPDILFYKQKVESDIECLYKGDSIPVANLQGILTKSLESVSIKTENDTETLLPRDFIIDQANLNSIRGTSEVLFKEIVQGTIETLAKSESEDFKNKNGIATISSLQDHRINNGSFNIKDVNTTIPLEEDTQPIIKNLTKSLESITTKKTSTEIMITPTEHPFYINEDTFITDDGLKIYSPIEEQKKDTSNLNISSTNNIDDGTTRDEDSINTKFVLPKSSSIINEALTTIKDAMGITSPAETLTFKEVKAKNENNVEALVSLHGPLHDAEAFKILETAADTLLQDTDQDMTLISKSSQDNIRESIDKHPKLEEHVEDIIKTGTTPSTDVVSYEELKRNAVDSTSLFSSKENKMDSNFSNSVTNNLNFQEDIEDKHKEKSESFNTIKSDLIKPDQVAFQGNQDESVINSVINTGEVSDEHVDGNSVVNIINDGNSITDIEKDENSIKLKTGILHDENYYKNHEVTLDDKIIIEGLETSYKSEDGIEIPMDVEPNQMSDIVRNSKEDFIKTTTIASDNVSIKNKGDESSKNHSLSDSYEKKENIHLNMAFQSFQTDEDGSVIRTLNFSSVNDSKRYPNDNILQFETIIRPNDGEIKIPIDSEKDIILQIKTDQKNNQRVGLIKSSPYFNDQINSGHESNVINKGSDGGSLFKDLALKNTSTVAKKLLDGTKSNETNLQQTLDDVYKDKLLPLHDIIKKLKNDIDELSKQQTLIKEKLYKTKRVQSNPTYNKKCGCIEMLLRR